MIQRPARMLRGVWGVRRHILSSAQWSRTFGTEQRARLLLKNAAQVVTVGGGSEPKLREQMNDVGVLENHSLLVGSDGRIEKIVPAGAPTESLLSSLQDGVERVVDCAGKVVLPGFVDCHTHAVFDGDRSHEHAMKLAGATYEEVHEAGGGINFTVGAVREASHRRLQQLLLERLDGMMRSGTTTCEVKTGYGLDFETELKMLQTIQAATAKHRMAFSNTYLIHAVPQGMTSAEVTVDVVENQLPALAEMVADGRLTQPVDFIDVFCEHGPSFFTPDDSRQILEAGKRLLGAEIAFHGDELSDQHSGVLAAEIGARSVSHLEMLNEDGVKAMAEAGVHAVLLPTTAYMLRLPHPPTRELIDAGAPVVLASDFNPNAFCYDMPAVMNLACVTFGMTMAEALVASTINAASALCVADECGSLEVGKRGDCIVLDAPKWEHIVYNMRPRIAEVFKDGVSVTRSASGPRQASLHTDPALDIQSLASGIDFDGPLPPRFVYDDDSLPHAPRRPVKLSTDLKRQVCPLCRM